MWLKTSAIFRLGFCVLIQYWSTRVRVYPHNSCYSPPRNICALIHTQINLGPKARTWHRQRIGIFTHSHPAKMYPTHACININPHNNSTVSKSSCHGHVTWFCWPMERGIMASCGLQPEVPPNESPGGKIQPMRDECKPSDQSEGWPLFLTNGWRLVTFQMTNFIT